MALSNDLPKGTQAIWFYVSVTFLLAALGFLFRFTARFLGSGTKSFLDFVIERVDSKISLLDDRLEKIESRESLIDPKSRQELINDVISRIKESASDEFLKKLDEQSQARVDEQNRDRVMRVRLSRTLDRLTSEIDDLKRRALINLMAGMTVTALGVISLAAMLIFSPDANFDPWQFISHYLPRLTLVILIEVFAYFFLRLYKSNLEDIKYFQNEITNIEAKHVALNAIFMTKEYAHLADVVSEISKTERNRILEKGQSTVEIERSRIEQDNLIDLVKTVAAALSKTEGKKPKDDKKGEK
ncbi:hypothetical protein [Paraburkholderia caribensis]|nr:hypothetical protein [Paraburkholderia caribensis]